MPRITAPAFDQLVEDMARFEPGCVAAGSPRYEHLYARGVRRLVARLRAASDDWSSG